MDEREAREVVATESLLRRHPRKGKPVARPGRKAMGQPFARESEGC